MNVQMLYHILLAVWSVQFVNCTSHHKNGNVKGLSKRTFTLAPTTQKTQGITCYECKTTRPDVSSCNTTICDNGQMCMLKTDNPGESTESFTMACGPTLICSIKRKRNLLIKCCDQDLCNRPVPTTTTPAKTTQTTTTTTTTTVVPAPHASCIRDVIFMVDDSMKSVPTLPVTRDFIIDVINGLDIGHDKTRVAMGTFSLFATTKWDLDRFTNKTALIHGVSSLHTASMIYDASNINGVEYLRRHFKKGNRENVPDVVIITTTGKMTSHLGRRWLLNGPSTERTAYLLHQKIPNVIAVTSGRVDQGVMKKFATDDHHFFYIPDLNNYDRLSLVRNVVNLVCQ